MCFLFIVLLWFIRGHAVLNLPQENSGHEKIWLCLRKSALWAQKEQASKHLHIYVRQIQSEQKKQFSDLNVQKTVASSSHLCL